MKTNEEGPARDVTGAAVHAVLHAMVEVEKSASVQCQHPACKHRVYKRIHVVNESSQLAALVSTCFEVHYGVAAELKRAQAFFPSKI